MEEQEDGPKGAQVEDLKARRHRMAGDRARLRALDRRWAAEGDSETLWEEEHALLIQLLQDGDARTVAKLAKRAKRALSGKGSAKDLADAALALWALERMTEAEPVLKAAMERLPANRYPWDLLLRKVSSGGSPEDEIAFIEGQLDLVPWKGFALLQIGTRRVDVAARALARKDLDECRKQLAGAKVALERAGAERDTTDEMRKTSERIGALVARLEQRFAAPDKSTDGNALKRLFRDVSLNLQLEDEVRVVADAAGVNLEGEADRELDLDELERIAFQEKPGSEQEKTITVIKVTPTLATAEDRRRKPEPPADDTDEG
jgi:hypothetical protein